jgi:hypothetical protein
MESPPGLDPGHRWRCGACGNLTRFDVESTERVRRFWHLDLSGGATVDAEERLEVTVGSVTCRWCGAADAIEVVPAPGTVPPSVASSGGVPSGGGPATTR